VSLLHQIVPHDKPVTKPRVTKKPSVTEIREAISVTGKHGRPKKDDAQSAAERMKAYRQRRKA
jgi:hypothetical protein